MVQESSSNHELNRFQAALEAHAAELEQVISRRDVIAVEGSPDQVEEIQRASERALAICNLDREFRPLKSVRAALRRIRKGVFGVCEECEEEIHPKRLMAIPWAALCVVCQEALDRCGEELRSTKDNVLIESRDRSEHSLPKAVCAEPAKIRQKRRQGLREGPQIDTTPSKSIAWRYGQA